MDAGHHTRVIRRLLLDTSSLMYRAFFGLPDTITSPDGRPVQAVHGYLDMTARLIANREPGEVVHCYDHDWRPEGRVRHYEGYKAERPDEPSSLTPQFPILREMLDALGMAQAEVEDWEAEDAIGSLVAAMPRRDRAEIVTGDRDLIQLVRDPQVRMLYTVRGVSNLEVLDEAAVEAKYGIPASRYADFATLRGDPSDGLPGVKGVGEKTARALVADYGSIEDLLGDLEKPVRRSPVLMRSAALRSRIGDAAGYLRAMADVVPIRTDLDVRLSRPEGDASTADALAERYGLTGPVRRLREALAG